MMARIPTHVDSVGHSGSGKLLQTCVRLKTLLAERCRARLALSSVCGPGPKSESGSEQSRLITP